MFNNLAVTHGKDTPDYYEVGVKLGGGIHIGVYPSEDYKTLPWKSKRVWKDPKLNGLVRVVVSQEEYQEWLDYERSMLSGLGVLDSRGRIRKKTTFEWQEARRDRIAGQGAEKASAKTQRLASKQAVAEAEEREDAARKEAAAARMKTRLMALADQNERGRLNRDAAERNKKAITANRLRVAKRKAKREAETAQYYSELFGQRKQCEKKQSPFLYVEPPPDPKIETYVYPGKVKICGVVTVWTEDGKCAAKLTSGDYKVRLVKVELFTHRVVTRIGNVEFGLEVRVWKENEMACLYGL